MPTDAMTGFVDLLTEALLAHASPEVALGQQKYMRDQFLFVGVKTPARREALRQVIGQEGMPEQPLAVAQLLWDKTEREFQYCAIDLLLRNSKRNEQTENLVFYERLVTTKSWWDTVDALAQVVGQHLAKFPEKRAEASKAWLESGNVWLIRTAVIFQLSYKKLTDEDLLFRNIRQAAHHPDFFVRKGIGWALREYAKVRPEATRAFVAAHRGVLSPLSQREALRRIGGGGD
jgi:3-methyladenine DNA glycosylase AlkD